MARAETLAVIGRVIVNPKFILGSKIVIAVIGGWMLAAQLDRGWHVAILAAIGIFVILDVQDRWERFRHRRKEKS